MKNFIELQHDLVKNPLQALIIKGFEKRSVKKCNFSKIVFLKSIKKNAKVGTLKHYILQVLQGKLYFNKHLNFAFIFSVNKLNKDINISESA